MNDPTNNEEGRFVDFLTKTSRETYNSPPETPRDEMWAVIQAERSALRDASGVVPIHRHRAMWWIGVAAALVIGVGLGRVSLQSAGDTEPAIVATGSGPASPVPATSAPVDEDAGDPEVRDAASTDDAAVEPTDDGTPETRLAQSDDRTAPPPEPEVRENRSTLPYRVAAANLLTRSETFLTMFKTDGADEELSAQFATWARTLLMQTRLMIDSPAGEDPQMRALLEDLELALVQIVQLGDQTDEEETRRIGEGLDDGQLLFKLRSLPDPKTVGT